VKRAYQDLETGAHRHACRPGSFVAPVERSLLRERKLAELRRTAPVVRSSAKFGITASDIVRLTRKLEGTDMDTVVEAANLTKHYEDSASGVSA